MESCTGLCPWTVIGGLTPAHDLLYYSQRKTHRPFWKLLFAALINLLPPFILQNLKKKKILRADIVKAFSNFWDKLGKIRRKSLEQIYNKLKTSKIHCHHPYILWKIDHSFLTLDISKHPAVTETCQFYYLVLLC